MNILITGASRGLGYAMANALRGQGIHDLHGHNVIAPTRQEMDVTDANSVADMCRKLEEHFFGLNLLINNAGGLCDTFDQTMALNAHAPLVVSKIFWPLLKAGRGSIINISSREGLSGDSFGYRDYSVAKAALNGVTRMLARNDDGVMVNACCPGPFDSRYPEACKQAARTPLWMALEMDRSITGKFFINREVVPW